LSPESRSLLKPVGSVTIEFPHLLRLIEHAAFDTIYHEHFSYISLYAIERVFRLQGLQIYDVEELPTHGGSLRIFATHTSRALEDSAALRRVRAEEERAGLADLDTYRRFSERVGACRSSLREFLAHAKSAGKVVAAYGAAAKGNTLLNFCDVTADDISMVADRNPHKQSKLLPGSHIPVVSPEELTRHKPDYVLILPWNLQNGNHAAARRDQSLGRPLLDSHSHGALLRMKFTATPLAGAFIVDIDPTSDERGFFARSFCAAEFAEYGLSAAALQCSVSYNVNKGTLRGMHYQAASARGGQAHTLHCRCHL
jgi:hypothetical protein